MGRDFVTLQGAELYLFWNIYKYLQLNLSNSKPAMTCLVLPPQCQLLCIKDISIQLGWRGLDQSTVKTHLSSVKAMKSSSEAWVNHCKVHLHEFQAWIHQRWEVQPWKMRAVGKFKAANLPVVRCDTTQGKPRPESLRINPPGEETLRKEVQKHLEKLEEKMK